MGSVVVAPLSTLQKYTKHAARHAVRFIELDLLRAVAILFMVFLHVLWDLDYFGIFPLNRGVYQFQNLVPALFFILVGICLVITTRKRSPFSPDKQGRHLFYRGLWILGFGMIITVVTMIFLPDRPIFFGVLHCIGLSIILCIPFLKFKAYNAIIAIGIIIFGLGIGTVSVNNPTLVHLIVGFHPGNMFSMTIDYFPLLPWFGVILFGVALGNVLYKDGKRQFPFPDLSKYKPVGFFSWIGKHSLAIYLIHQPIIAGILEGYLFLSKII